MNKEKSLWDLLRSAVYKNDLSEVQRLVKHQEHKTDNEFFMECETEAESFLDALVMASGYGYINIVKFLLQCGAYVDYKGLASDNETALHKASSNGDLEMVKLLIAHDAKINARDDALNTPLHNAYNGNHENVIEFLIAHGAQTDARNYEQYIPSEMQSC